MPPRLVHGVLLTLIVTALFSAWCGTAMTWDGSYQFCHTLIAEHPYVYLTRFHSWIVWQPLVALMHFTDDLTALKMAFGLPFLLAPAIGLGVSWWIVGDAAPRTIVWVLFGVAVATLPGQIFVINDSIFQQHLFWPIFIALIVPARLTWRKMVALTILAIFQFSHQIGAPLFFGGALAAGWMAVATPKLRRSFALRAAGAMGLSLAAALKIVIFPDPYAAAEATWASAADRWHAAVTGSPIIGLSLIWLAAGLIFLSVEPAQKRNLKAAPSRSRLIKTFGALMLLGVAAVIWIHWAAEPRRWAYASEYRRWILPLDVPFFGLALLEARRAAGQEILTPHRLYAGAAMFAASLFALVLGIQSVGWLNLGRRLEADVNHDSRTIIPLSAVDWTHGTPLQHWSLPAYAVVLQGKTPEKMLVLNEADADAIRQTPPGIPLAPGERRMAEPGPAGWFDFRPLINRARDAAMEATTSK